MTRTVYVVGAAGAGKSTFTAQALVGLGWELGPYEEFTRGMNGKLLTRVKSHVDPERSAMYWGALRAGHPGTDSLPLPVIPIVADWLRTAELPERMLAEGQNMAGRPIFEILADRTELLVVHLTVSERTQLDRFARRGSHQKPSWVRTTAVKAANAAAFAFASGARVSEVDAEKPRAWDAALDLVEKHLA